MFKNINKEELLPLSSLIECKTGEVISKTLSDTSECTITLFSFSAGESISSHKALGDAAILILEGEATLTIEEKSFSLKKDSFIVIPKGAAHSVTAKTNYKMLLIVSK